VDTDTGVWNLFITDVTSFLQLLVNRLNVFVEVGDGESLPTVRALCALIVVHLSDMPRQVGHGKLLLTVRARLLDPLMCLSNMSGKVVNRNILLAVWAVGLLSQVDALHVIVQQLLSLELLLAVGALVIADFLVEILNVVVKILVLLVTDVTGRSLRQVDLLDVILQSILGNKLLLTERALGNLSIYR